MRYSDIDKLIRQKLSGIYPDRESGSIGRLVMEYLTGLSWVQIRLNADTEFSEDQENLLANIIARLQHHEPVQYILGETEFYGLTFKVRQGVLIPRGETEELVEWVIRADGRGQKAKGKEEGTRLKAQGKEEGVKGLRVLDIGCGCGAIAVALAKHLAGAEVVAADISEEALRLTGENAALNKTKITLCTLNILAPQPLIIPVLSDLDANADAFIPDTCMRSNDTFDIIVSNPPYVPKGEMTAMDRHVVDFEPEMALFVPDDDPLVFYRAIAGYAAANLNREGQVFVEIHDRLGGETSEIFRKWFINVELRKDIHGKDRMIRAYHG